MEISFPTQSSFKSTLKTYWVLLLAIKVITFWEISPLALLCALNYGIMLGKWGISNMFFFSLAHWLLKS